MQVTMCSTINLWIRNTMVSFWQLTRAFSNHSRILFGLEPFLYLISFLSWNPFIKFSLGQNPFYLFHWDGTLFISFSLGRNPFIYFSLGRNPFYILFIGTEPFYIFFIGTEPFYNFFIGTEPFYIFFWLSFASYYIWIASINFSFILWLFLSI